MAAHEIQEYILLPKKGVRSLDSASNNLLSSLPRARSTQPSEEVFRWHFAATDKPISVIDAVQENGARLVALDTNTAKRVNDDPQSPLRALPVVYYERPDPIARPLAGVLTVGTSIKVICQDSTTGGPVSGAEVIAFTNFATRAGASGMTDVSGQVVLGLAPGQIDRIYVYSPAGYWGAYRSSVNVSAPYIIQLTPVSLSSPDALRRFYPKNKFTIGTGVRVGVIDTGVGPHKDLNIIGGTNTVTGEPANNFYDGDKHGTHVAGLIGARGVMPTGLSGMAPGVELRAYRVFGENSNGASNYAILKAMIYTANDGCDIINLSLGGGPYDAIVAEAIDDARNQGILIVVAAGNDGRKRVNYPAAYPGATAVSATGIQGTFPAGSLQDGDINWSPTSSAYPQHFIADFSNIGPEIAVSGLGVGVLSTLPNNLYGPMSGTSMAAPVIAGAAASLLSQAGAVYSMARDKNRSNAIERLLQQNCIRQGFGIVYEGYGLPDPTMV
jgi:hypothetical protein